MGEIVVAYARADETNAKRVVKKLESLGFTVRCDEAGAKPSARRKTGKSAAPQVVLWSRNFASARSAGAARARTALLAARLDAAPLPTGLKAGVVDLRTWRGRDDHRDWRRLTAQVGAAAGPAPVKPATPGSAKAPAVSAKPVAAAKAAPAPEKKKGGAAALFWLAGAAAAAAAGGAAVFMTMH